MLCKLLSQLLFKRLQPTLDASQYVDHAGFRPGFSTTDFLDTFKQLIQRAAEWHSHFVSQPLTHTVEHSSVRKALREQGIEEPYIMMLPLDGKQRATVHTDKRETKQGDPLSTPSLNSLLQYIMKLVCEKWNRNNRGVSPRLQTTMFSSAAHSNT